MKRFVETPDSPELGRTGRWRFSRWIGRRRRFGRRKLHWSTIRTSGRRGIRKARSWRAAGESTTRSFASREPPSSRPRARTFSRISRERGRRKGNSDGPWPSAGERSTAGASDLEGDLARWEEERAQGVTGLGVSAVALDGLGFPVSRGEVADLRRTGGRRPESRYLSASLRIARADLVHHEAKSASRKAPGIWATGEPPARRGTYLRREILGVRGQQKERPERVLRPHAIGRGTGIRTPV